MAYVTPLFHELHWLLLYFLVQFKVLILTFIALHGMGPSCMKDHLSLVTSGHPTKSSRRGMLQVPSGVPPGGIQERHLFCCICTLWNFICPEVKLAPFLLAFWKSWKCSSSIKASEPATWFNETKWCLSCYYLSNSQQLKIMELGMSNLGMSNFSTSSAKASFVQIVIMTTPQSSVHPSNPAT